MSYRNQLRIKTYRALKKFQCFIHIFNLVYPQLAPSYIVKGKIIITLYACICMHRTIAKLSLFPFPFTCNLNFCFILKSSWWSGSEFVCYVLVFYSGSQYFTCSLLAVLLLLFFFLRKKASFKLSKFTLGSEAELN